MFYYTLFFDLLFNEKVSKTYCNGKITSVTNYFDPHTTSLYVKIREKTHHTLF